MPTPDHQTTIPNPNRSKYRLIIVLVIVVIVIVMLKIFTPATPITKGPLTQQNFDGSSSSFKLKFVGNQPEFPGDLPIGHVVVESVSQAELLAPLINQYQLQPEPGDPLVWTGPDYVLVKDEGSGMYTLATQLLAERSSTINETEIITQAENLAQKLFPDTHLKVVPSDTRYLAGSEEQKEVGLAQAEVIELVLAPTMSNYPVMIKNNSQSLVQMTFDSSQKLIKLNFLPEVAGLSYSPGMGQEFKVIKIDQAVANTNRGDGAIISADSRQVTRLNLNSKITGNLNRVEIEYRSNDAQQLLPYYRFSGLLQLDGLEFTADIITPAIDLDTIPDS